MTASESAVDAGPILQALGDATRRQIVEALGRGPLSVSALAKPFDMSLTAIVQHLRVLEDCGLVTTEKVGRVRTCQLRTAGLDALARWVDAQRPEWHRRIDRLADLLDSKDR
ncbi:ArsR/SmtB family transcription factor [Sphingomonas hengshuiensis]|uniref:ArsR family transcriptional regulator n=1 Tax=Sphingomonas hengshuiensis TaxID=1609977 RepID=A0A7U4LEG8_9SPHN|nr:metalloregulator ArsR/SmtB family transcription factor [Sphingomonas hengshuiensis]AJP71442.1 ArsR family transcriptional regulator [Sphingomonas hengshuiensis]